MAEMNLVVTIAEDGTVSEKYVPLSKAEIAQRELDAIAYAEAEAQRAADAAALDALKAGARLKLEAGEPLTAEEAALLIP
jgi:hypothetical protein